MLARETRKIEKSRHAVSACIQIHCNIHLITSTSTACRNNKESGKGGGVHREKRSRRTNGLSPQVPECYAGRRWIVVGGGLGEDLSTSLRIDWGGERRMGKSSYFPIAVKNFTRWLSSTKTYPRSQGFRRKRRRRETKNRGYDNGEKRERSTSLTRPRKCYNRKILALQYCRAIGGW